MATKSKKPAKKPATKVTKTMKEGLSFKGKAAKAKKPAKASKNFDTLHEKLIKLFLRKDGATLTEIKSAGYDYAPGIFALRIAERRGYKTSVVKKEGERTRYLAKGTAKAA